MEYYSVLLPLAMILILSKILVTFSKKLGLPQVVGMLLAGVIIGLINYIPNQKILTDVSLEGVGFIAKIGVILIMFSAGIGTDLKQIKNSGGPSAIITAAGVILPLGLGFSVAAAFNGGFVGMTREQLLSDLFYGVILTATSVSVTVATLKELGKLNGKMGTTVVTAAILDDIIGVIVLSFVIGMKGGENAKSPWIVLLLTLAFFAVAVVGGFLIRKLFVWMEKRFPHHRRLPIFGLALCFFCAYVSEKWFGVADITGAFVAGLMISGTRETGYIDRKTDIMSYMIFVPVFFANIGMTTKFDGMNGAMAGFGVCFILAGLVGKAVGCGGTALACKYSVKDALRIGVGMMARAEVALVCAQKGVENGLVDSAIMPFILILIILTSFLTPLILKISYKKEALANLPVPVTEPAAPPSENVMDNSAVEAENSETAVDIREEKE